MYLPLSFFFNRNPGLALPLIALQYHEVKLHITFGSATELAAVGVDTSYTPTATLYVSYIFLDTDERRRFAQTSHEYLNRLGKKAAASRNWKSRGKARCRSIASEKRPAAASTRLLTSACKINS